MFLISTSWSLTCLYNQPIQLFFITFIVWSFFAIVAMKVPVSNLNQDIFLLLLWNTNFNHYFIADSACDCNCVRHIHRGAQISSSTPLPIKITSAWMEWISRMAFEEQLVRSTEILGERSSSGHWWWSQIWTEIDEQAPPSRSSWVFWYRRW